MLKKLYPHQSQSNGFKESVSRLVEVVGLFLKEGQYAASTRLLLGTIWFLFFCPIFFFVSRAVEIKNAVSPPLLLGSAMISTITPVEQTGGEVCKRFCVCRGL